tara:strand:- start:2679 stop:4529 length:1851 start_codon:yes stop_codon:yes gene_type:complete
MATYTVKSGDTFGEIADQYGLSTSELQRINPQLKNINVIEVGDQIIVPGQTAMDLSATDIVDTGGQTQTIQRQPIRRTPTLPTSQTDKVADFKTINPDSSLFQKRLTKIAENPKLTGVLDVGKEMLLEAGEKILPSVYSDEAKALEPEQKISTTDALKEMGGEVVKDFLMPEDEQQDPTQDGTIPQEVGQQAIATADALQQKPAVEATPEVEEVTETEVVKITNPEDVKKVVQDEKTADAIIEYGNTNFMFEDGLDKSALERIDKDIRLNNEKLAEISQGKLKPYFGKNDTGRKFLAAIAAGLGAYASAITGGPNSALNIINKAIDDDLAIQKEQLERQRLSILDQNKILAESRAELYAEADRLFNQQVAQAGLQLDQEQINTTKEGIAQRREQAELENKQAQIAAEFEVAQEFKGGIIPGMGATALDAGFIDLPAGGRRDKAAENAAKYMEGYFKVGGSGDKKEKEQIMKKVRKVGYFKLSESERAKLGLIGQIKALVDSEKYNIQIPFTDARDTLRSLHQELRLFYQKDVMGAGANLTLNEMIQVLNLTGDLEAQFGGRLMINSGRYEKLMDRLQAGLEEKRIAKREAFGIKPLTSKQSKQTDKSYVNFLESVN